MLICKWQRCQIDDGRGPSAERSFLPWCLRFSLAYWAYPAGLVDW